MNRIAVAREMGSPLHHQIYLVLADGISTALVTTLIGLVLAIPAMVFHSILKNRVQRMVLEIGMVSESLMGRFAQVGKQKSAG